MSLDNSAETDAADRISPEEACALLDVAVSARTFRRRYLTGAWLAMSTERFGIRTDDADDITLSRRLILEHRAAVIRDGWGNVYEPSARWADEVRRTDQTVAAYEAWERRALADDAARRHEAGLPDPQGDLFSP